MSPGEMWYRFSRNFKARWDKSTGRSDPHNTPAINLSANHETLLANFRQRQPFPWQSSSDSEIRALFMREWREERAATIRAADELLAHRLKIFDRTLPFNGQIAWHFDVLADKQIPLRHWTELPYWHADTAPGVKYIWELNRLQHFVTLAKAYLLTDEDKYSEELAQQWSDWLDKNPPQYGINWASPLEMALRLISLTWALQMAKSSRHITPVLYHRVLQSVADHASLIADNLSFYSSANNHLLGEALGLVYAGTYYPELHEAARWRDLGFSILLDQIPRQVCADGVIREQTSYYQRYVFDFCLLARLAADQAGQVLSPEFHERTEKMAEFIHALMDESGDVPDIGDADGGQTLRLSESSGNPYRILLSVAACLFGRKNFKAAAKKRYEEQFWLLGLAGLDAYEQIGEQVHNPLLEEFHEGGYLVIRSRPEGVPQRAVFDFGSLGLDAMSSHGHSDALQFLLSAAHQPVLIDSGTFTYRGDRRWRDYFRGTAAHNTVVVDGQNQSEIVGPFQWGRRANAHLLSCTITSDRTELVARQDGYRHKGIMHIRRIMFDQVGVWRIEDLVQGSGRHRIQVFWHFAPCEVEVKDDRYIFQFPGARVFLHGHSAAALEKNISIGGRNPIQGWFSPAFAVKKPNPVLCINAVNALPIQITTEITIEKA